MGAIHLWPQNKREPSQGFVWIVPFLNEKFFNLHELLRKNLPKFQNKKFQNTPYSLEKFVASLLEGTKIANITKNIKYSQFVE